MRTVFMNCSMVYSLTVDAAFFGWAVAVQAAAIRVRMSSETRLFRFMERYSFLWRSLATQVRIVTDLFRVVTYEINCRRSETTRGLVLVGPLRVFDQQDQLHRAAKRECKASRASFQRGLTFMLGCC